MTDQEALSELCRLSWYAEQDLNRYEHGKPPLRTHAEMDRRANRIEKLYIFLGAIPRGK